MAPSVPLGEALGLRAAARFGFAYAPVRAAGSLGFLAANVAVGWALDRASPDLVIWVVSTGFLATALFGALHPGGGAAPGAAGADRALRGEALALIRTPVFALFALALALCQSSHVVFYVYSVLAWQEQGLSGALIGWLWAFGVIAEMALMLGPGRRIVARIGPAAAIACGGLAGVVRWTSMALAPGLAWLGPLQGVHAFTFALAHLGAMAFMAQAIPPRLAGSAQGLLSGVAMGVSSALAMAIAAAIVSAQGFGAAYGFAGALCLVSVAAALALRRAWTGGTLADETPREV